DKFQPQLAIINTTTPSINSDMVFVEEYKKRYKDCFVAIFGTHVTVLHEKIMERYHFIDCIIRNEPEISAKHLACALQNKQLFGGIKGCTMRINESIVISEDREYNQDLDSLGFPAWEHFNKYNYIHPIFNKPYVMVNTSRGCVHKCIFCVGHIFYGKQVRYRSVESVIDEIENYVVAKLGIRHIWFYADDFTASPEYVKKLCRAIINRKIKITWWTNTRVDKHDEEMFRCMKESGCFMLSIGGESGNSGILQKIKKGTTPEYIKNTVNLLRKVGINSLVYFLIGLPGETRETIKETLNFAMEINPDYIEFYPATPYPGTEFFDMANDRSLIVDTNWDNYMCGGNHFVVEIPGVKRDELDEILIRAYRAFYLRPAYIKIFLKRALKPAEFLRLISFGLTYFRRFTDTTNEKQVTNP
ncbi:MAG: radical SAM protein, partial [Candidatus Magnetobacterium sp. LHC-1]